MADAQLTLIELDDRRRAQLGRLLPADAPTRYAVNIDDDGVITLSPARIVTEHELRLLAARPDLVETIRRAAVSGEVPEGYGPRRRPPRR